MSWRLARTRGSYGGGAGHEHLLLLEFKLGLLRSVFGRVGLRMRCLLRQGCNVVWPVRKAAVAEGHMACACLGNTALLL